MKLNPFGDVAGPADSLFVKGEAVGSLGPLQLGGELRADDCGLSVKAKCGTFLINCAGEVSAGVDEKVSDQFQKFKNDAIAEDGKWKAGLSAKLTGGACLGSKLL